MASFGFPRFAAPLDPFHPVGDAVMNRCPVPRERASRRILIQRNGAHGDILMATPVLSALRAAYPDAHITWLVEHKERTAIDAHPEIDELLLFDSVFWKRMIRHGLLPVWLARALRFRGQLREKRYDIFISFQPEEWQLIARHCGAGVRIGIFDTFRQFENDKPTSQNTRFYTDFFAHPDLPTHRTEQYLLALKPLGIEPTTRRMTMGFTREDDQAAREVLQGEVSGRSLVILAPMTTWESRCWDGARYAELGDRLYAEGATIALIGSAKEAEPINAVAARMQTKPLVVAGRLTFREMAAFIARASLLVSGDTGPMHVAAAVGTPFLSLFGPTPADGRKPLAGRGTVLLHPVPCGPCDQKVCPNVGETHVLCMNLLTVDEVAAAARQLLAKAVAA